MENGEGNNRMKVGIYNPKVYLSCSQRLYFKNEPNMNLENRQVLGQQLWRQ